MLSAPDVYQEAMEAWRPGRPVAEIARDTTAVFEKHGARGLLQGSLLGACGRTSLTQGLTLEPGMIISPEWITTAALGNFW